MMSLIFLVLLCPGWRLEVPTIEPIDLSHRLVIARVVLLRLLH